jgi:DNA repair ATPase RecN
MNENYVIDVITNLARRVHSLESQLRDTQNNVEKLAEELATVKHLADSNEQDIAMLDERSHVLNAINKYYEEGCR